MTSLFRFSVSCPKRETLKQMKQVKQMKQMKH